MVLVTTKSPNAELRGATLRVQNLTRYYATDIKKIVVICLRKKPNDIYQGIPVVHLGVRPTDIPLIISALISESISSALFKRATLSRHITNNDSILFHLIRPYQTTAARRVVIDMCESLADNFQNRAEFYSRRDLRHWLFRFESNRLRRLEARIWGDECVDKIVITHAAFPAYEHLPHRVVPNWRDIPDIGANKSFDGHRIAFLGHVDYELNMASIVMLQAWIKNISPDITLEVVGTVSDRNRAFLDKYRNIRLHGFLDDPEPILSGCVVGVCIIPGATGLQNKVLDYLACGVPPIVSRNVCDSFPGYAPFALAETSVQLSESMSKFNDIDERMRYLGTCVGYVRQTEKEFLS